MLKSEMEMDAGRDPNRGAIASKVNELAKAEQGAANARSAQMQILGKTNQNLVDDKEEQDSERMEEKAAAEQKKEEILGYTSDRRPVTEEEEARITARA